MCNSVVRWRKFAKKTGNTVQCYRCQRYGHGSKFCYLKPVCVKCSQQHLTADCKSVLGNSAEQNAAMREQIKCANCGGNHTASYKGCSSRKAYLQQLARTKAKRKTANQTAPTNHQDREHRQRAESTTPPTVQPPTNPPASEGRRLYSQVVRDGAETSNTQRSSEVSSALFTISEFMGLARDLLFRLKRCKSKEDQFLALSELMIQYVYNGK